ncbi:hypothetical protein L7F22_046973 [Adiantum nelumboides]|nr:hypothetical protein [Adiantum nelumboides]
MDVNNAFLNGLLEEEVCMQQPEGYIVAGKESMVCKLNKSLYGLKQVPRAWYEKIDDHLQSQGFQRSNVDHTLYYKVQGKDIVLVILYVYDLILIGSNEAMVEDVQSKLSKEFEMKDLVNNLAQYMQATKVSHWIAVKRVLRYKLEIESSCSMYEDVDILHVDRTMKEEVLEENVLDAKFMKEPMLVDREGGMFTKVTKEILQALPDEDSIIVQQADGSRFLDAYKDAASVVQGF